MDWLKEIFKEVTDEQLKEFKLQLGKQYIPKDDYKKTVDGLRLELKTSQDKFSEVSTKLGDFEKVSGENENLKSELGQYKTELETFKNESENRLNNTKKKYAIEKALIKNNAHKDSVDLLVNEFDLDKINLTDDGSIADLENVLKPIKEKRSGLFAKETVETKEPDTGDDDTGSDASDLWKAIGLTGYKEA